MQDILNGDRVFITGSSRGIGRAIALAMANAGAHVAVHYHKSAEAAELVAREIRELRRECIVVQGDLEDADQRARIVDTIGEQWGALDVLVANAAATAFKPVTELRPYHLHRTYTLVVESLVDLVQRSLPLMTQSRHGRIITISSQGSQYTLPRYACIGAGKAAMEAMTRYLAAELGPFGITCNAISPGVIDTDSVRYYAGEHYESFLSRVAEATPLGRLVQPDDVAAAVIMMASPYARMVTGQVVQVDGGISLKTPGFEGL